VSVDRTNIGRQDHRSFDNGDNPSKFSFSFPSELFVHQLAGEIEVAHGVLEIINGVIAIDGAAIGGGGVISNETDGFGYVTFATGMKKSDGEFGHASRGLK
jgi:hypothetical protein